MNQFGLFDLDERMAKLSEKGHRLNELESIVDFEQFRPLLGQVVRREIAAHNSLSYELYEFYIRDRLKWMRFFGLGLSDRIPIPFATFMNR
jgi:hypothetical protein